MASTLSDWFKNLPPPCRPTRRNTRLVLKTNRDALTHFSRAFLQSRVFASRVVWFTVLSESFVIDYSGYVGFAVTVQPEN